MPEDRDYLEDAWAELHDANQALGWFVGRPAYESRRDVPWSQYATDRFSKVKVGRRASEWTAIGPTEVACVRAMAKALREISAGRVPR